MDARLASLSTDARVALRTETGKRWTYGALYVANDTSGASGTPPPAPLKPNDCHHHTPKLATFASWSTAPRKGPLQPARSTTTRGVYLLRGQPYSIIPYDHTLPLVYPALRTLSNVYVSTLLFMNRGSYYHCTDWTPGSLPTGRLVVYRLDAW